MSLMRSRVCGDCTLCCKLLHVKELKKPSHTDCLYQIDETACRPGCSIYNNRPQSCKDFECLWLQEDDMPADLRPDKSHVVLWVNETGEILIASVDPKYPLAYREGEMGRLLQVMLQTPNAKIGVIVGESRFPLSEEFVEYHWLTTPVPRVFDLNFSMPSGMEKGGGLSADGEGPFPTFDDIQ